MLETFRLFELNILNLLQAWCQNGVFDKIMPVISFIGNLGIVWIVVAVALLFTKKYRLYGILIGIGLIIGVVVGNFFLKEVIDRARPFAFNAEIALLIKRPLDPSFPSGHTMSSFIAATILAFAEKKRFGIPAFILATLIAFSRMYLYVHFPSDVIGGAMIGMLIGVLLFYLTIKRFNKLGIVRAELLRRKLALRKRLALRRIA